MRDPLFEFDAPTHFLDLSALAAAKESEEEHEANDRQHDKWFDVFHEDHSKPSIDIIEALSKHVLKKKTEIQNKRTSLENVRKEGWSERRVTNKPYHDGSQYKQRTERSAKSVLVTSENKKLPKNGGLGYDRKRNTVKIKSSIVEKKRSLTQTTRSGAKMSQMASTASKKRVRELADAKREVAELQQLLDKHNRGIKGTKHTYEPRQHSVRDVRLWEKHSKKKYYDLSPSSRATANASISHFLEELKNGQISS